MKNIKRGAFLAVLAFFLYSCEKEVAIAPFLEYEGEADMTIRELLNIGSGQLPDKTITGFVVSSDEQGNFYKTLVIQDENAGIQIKVANTSLYARYHIGQQVFVKCKDLRLGEYGGLPQIGVLNVEDSSRLLDIPAKYEFNHIYRHGLVKPQPAPFVITAQTTITELNEHLNMYIEIPNVGFKLIGVPFVDPAAAIPYTSRDLTLQIGTAKLTVNTSNYVKDDIALANTPPGTGTVRGILTKFNTTYQIVLRSSKDIDFKVWEIIYNVNDHLSQTMFGWRNVPNGASWTTSGSQPSNANFQITGTGEASNSWLVSPVLNLSKFDSTYVHFDRFIQGNDDLDLYYTTKDYNPNESFVASNWTKASLSMATIGSWDNDIAHIIPKSTKAIAFKYIGTNSKVFLRNVKVEGLTQFE